MRFLATFQLYDFLDTLVSFVTAFVLGALIGAERQYRQRTAGLRTNVRSRSAPRRSSSRDAPREADGAVRVIPMWCPGSASSAPVSS
jgi:putative Mg2+ transporter-C (MgtC) family protein